jgi:isoquinoline 1-oxidoreductase beta subunit
MKKPRFDPRRRQFLLTSVTAGAGLTLGVYLPGCSREVVLPAAGPGKAGGEVVADYRFEPNAFVRITPDNRVIVIAKHLEMGQGTYTGLATLVAEELDATWEQVEIEAAPANAKLYNNLFWGPMQGTGGSTAIANSFKQMREAGATARAMLVQAAAQKWNVPANEISVSRGVVQHQKSKQQASFGELAELAGKQSVPEDVFLKDPDEFQLIGKQLSRKDNLDKITGKAIYTQDIQLPGMLVAVVAHAPRFGGKVKSFDASQTNTVKGVTEVVQISNGVAVLATNTWSAIKGRNALNVEWDNSNAFGMSSTDLLADYKNKAKQPGQAARREGDVDKTLKAAKKVLEANFTFPYLAHAAMEPMNCVVRLDKDGCEVWNGEQFQTGDQGALAQLFGLKPEQVKINMLYAGGSFGRRANPKSDYLLEAASIVKTIGGKAPVKLVWTREDDMRGGYYRPFYYHELKASLDKDGMPTAWQHRIVGQSILANTPFEGAMVKDGIDATSVEGASNLPYAIPNVSVELNSPKLPVPVQWWRSVGSTHTAFAVETFIDQLARTAEQDPVAYRRKLLQQHPRHLGVLNLAAEKANWGQPLAKNQARGLAVHESFNSYVAQVAQVTLHDNNSFSVDRVVIAVDCGLAVNPDIIRAQMEGGMGFGLAAALSSELTLENGGVVQSNFHDYLVLRMNQMPAVEVHIVNSTEAPTGVGEPATPVIAPAVANALYALTGKPFDRLPLQLSA